MRNLNSTPYKEMCVKIDTNSDKLVFVKRNEERLLQEYQNIDLDLERQWKTSKAQVRDDRRFMKQFTPKQKQNERHLVIKSKIQAFQRNLDLSESGQAAVRQIRKSRYITTHQMEKLLERAVSKDVHSVDYSIYCLSAVNQQELQTELQSYKGQTKYKRKIKTFNGSQSCPAWIVEDEDLLQESEHKKTDVRAPIPVEQLFFNSNVVEEEPFQLSNGEFSMGSMTEAPSSTFVTQPLYNDNWNLWQQEQMLNSNSSQYTRSAPWRPGYHQRGCNILSQILK